LAKALKNANDNHICVLDLKSDNTLYDSNSNTTFLIGGKSFEFFDDEIFDTYKKRKLISGTKPTHFPPEYFKKVTIASYAMDIYCFGRMIINAKNKKHLKELNENLKYSLNLLAKVCLKEDPNERPTIGSVIEYLTTVKHLNELATRTHSTPEEKKYMD